MLAPALTAIRDYFEANYTGLEHRWPYEDWPAGADPEENGRPFIEIEVIGGNDELRSFGEPGNRLSIHDGLVRFYIFWPRGNGVLDAQVTADQIASFMKRAEFGQSEGRTVRTLDFSSHIGAASVERGNFLVLMCSVPFDWYYVT